MLLRGWELRLLYEERNRHKSLSRYGHRSAEALLILASKSHVFVFVPT
jgi:hypothetical protein